jgi:flagellar assembly protein FliH
MNTLSSESRQRADAVSPFKYLEVGGPGGNPVASAQAARKTGEYTDESASPPEISKQQLETLLAHARSEAAREADNKNRTAFEEELKTERAKIAEAIQAFNQERRSYYAQAEKEVVSLALAIAAKILHREAQVDKVLVAALVRSMLEGLDRGTNAVVRIAPQEAVAWKHYFEEWQTPNMQIVPDATVGASSYVVETEMGTTDFGLQAQLKEIEQGFFDLLAQRPEVK